MHALVSVVVVVAGIAQTIAGVDARLDVVVGNEQNEHRTSRDLLDFPTSGCGTQFSKFACDKYNGCLWVPKICRDRYPPSPTAAPITPTTPKPTLPKQVPDSGSCATSRSESDCTSYTLCWWAPTIKKCLRQATVKVKTNKPSKADAATGKPVAKEGGSLCNLPPSGCPKMLKAGVCNSWSACFWNGKRCVGNVECILAPTSPPTNPPVMSETKRIPLAQQCATPISGCQALDEDTCSAFNGCYWSGSSCAKRDCSEFDCLMRRTAFDFAKLLLPRCTGVVPPLIGGDSCPNQLRDIHDGLELGQMCGEVFNYGPKATGSAATKPLPGLVFYVSSQRGDDASGTGSILRPYKTIQRAVGASRANKGVPRAVLLMSGTYQLTEPVTLTSEDSKLTIAPKGEDAVIIQGGIPLPGLNWEATQANDKIMVADVSGFSSSLQHLSTIYFNGNPAIRARSPNGDPITQGLHTVPSGYFPDKTGSWPKGDQSKADSVLTVGGIRPANTKYTAYSLARGGTAKIFNPPVSYWSVENPTAGGGCKFEVPAGVGYTSGLPGKFQTPSDLYIHAYHPIHWGNWIFKVKDQSSGRLWFDKGGFQEARGSCGDGASEWFVENALELLDAPNEYYLDTTNWKLYYMPNTTDEAIPTPIAAVTKRLFQVLGSPEDPVKDVKISGLNMQYTMPTHMDDHEVPSAGDWSITRNAAVFLEGVENCVVEGNRFLHMGGNGVFLSKYSRNTRIAANSFKYMGASCILVVGDPKYDQPRPWDMTDGLFPKGTVVSGNIGSEIGIIVSQSSGFFQALGEASTVYQNVFFNLQRAAINFNDGLGGGNMVERNLIFNTVRTTIDHGPFNSWDRQPYTQVAPDGSVSGEPQYSFIKQNMMIGGYHGIKGIDHDDGSTHWENSLNVVVYGYQKFKGKEQNVHDNLFLFGPEAGVYLSELNGGGGKSRMKFQNNKVVVKTGEIMYLQGNFDYCSPSEFVASGNDFYNANAFPAGWKSCGQDTDSRNGKMPSTTDMISWMYAMLNMKPIEL